MQYLGPGLDMKTVFKTTKISEKTQQHLSKVYSTLLATVMSAFAGAYVSMSSGLVSTSAAPGAMFGGFIVMLVLACTKTTNVTLRIGLMMLFGLLEGLSLSPLLQMAVAVDERIVATAFLGTATIFLCFSLAAITSKRRSFLYLGGILGSTLTFLLISSLLNVFFQSMFLFNVELYLGLAMFVGYILFDTQVIIERAENGNDDFVWDAMKLFIDLVIVFVPVSTQFV
uniref:Bax inhibitor 1 n=1 Tax=Lotharella globosa TaxID=91324 RepID=A0A7S4DXW7_9EUKA